MPPRRCRRTATRSRSTARHGSSPTRRSPENGGTDDELKRALVDATLGVLRISVLYGPTHHDEAERAAERGRPLAEDLGNIDTLASFHTFTAWR